MARLSSITPTESMSDSDYFIVIVSGQEYLISKENMQKIFSGLTAEQTAKLAALNISGDGSEVLTNKGSYIDVVNLFDRTQFDKNSSGKIELIDYHTHNNLSDVLNKFTADENGKLFFDGNEISAYTLPKASSTELGGVKVDGSTITINSDGVISGSANYELPTASTATLGGIKIDGDTVKINNGVISVDVIGNWSAGVNYPVGYFCIYNNKLFQCISANSDTEFNESNWILIGGTAVKEWAANTEYDAGDLIIKENALYKCNTAHTSGTEFDNSNWTLLTGAKGDKGDSGNDGYSPTITIENIEGGVTLKITDANGANSVTIYNGTNGSDGADGADGINGTDGADGITPSINSENKHWMIGETDTGIVAQGVTTISTNKVDLSCTLAAVDWSSTLPYTQTVNVEGITSELNPRIDVIISDNVVTGKKEEVAFSCLTKVITGDGFITAYCYDSKPEVDLNIIIEVI